MHNRDKEIARMINYAKGLNIQVYFRQHKPGYAGAEWVVNEDSEQTIVIYVWKKQSKTLLILNFLHELAHAKAFIKNKRKLSEKVLNAFSNSSSDISDIERKIIFKEESSDSKLRHEIAQELDLKIPKWKIDVDIALDKYIYYTWYKTNKFPTYKEINKKKKQLKEKYVTI